MRDRISDINTISGEFSVTENLQGKSYSDPREQALKDLAAFCLGIIPSRVVGSPDWQDAACLNDDLDLFARKVDRVISAYGDYAQSTIGISEDDRKLFDNQLLDALEGNAMYAVTSQIETNLEYADEDAAADAYEFRRGI